MWKKYSPYVSSIIFLAAAFVGITLMGVFIYGAVTGILGGDGLFQAPFFYRTVADALFYEGGIMLTFGTLVEFFLRSHSHSLARKLMLPYTMANRTMAQSEVPDDMAGETYAGGWMLILVGGILFIVSLAFAIVSMK